MKIRMTVTVELDPQDWADEYGLEISQVRDDVKSKVNNDLNELLVSSLHIARDVRVA